MNFTPQPKSEAGTARLPSIRGYQLASKIGEGRVACVYLGHDARRRAKVALKVLKADRMADPAVRQRFTQEWAALRSIAHDHVVRVYDHAAEGDLAYIAMEYLDGGNLRQQMDAGVSPDRAPWLLQQAALGLAATHRRSVVHRDVKPENLLLRGSTQVVLADFGVAAMADKSADLLPRGMFGSPAYAAPEQTQGGAACTASDVYALGVVCFELLCGRRPFDGQTRLEVIAQHLVAPIPRLPPRLARWQPLIDRMLEKDQTQRLPDGDCVLELIERIGLLGEAAGAGDASPFGGLACQPSTS